MCNNYKSATCPQNRIQVESQIKEELRLGRYIITPHKPTIVSALGAIPKPDGTGVRLIHDCSRPLGQGVNAYADPESFSFESVDTALKYIKPGSFMAKIDIKSAYRHVGIHPDNYHVTGLQWHFAGDPQPTFMYDTRLMFGASESVGCFHRLTQSVVRMVQRRVQCAVLCYLDDFLIISDSAEACKQSMDILLSILLELGFNINWDKLVTPTNCITFLGILLNSISMTMSIPEAKLCEIKNCAEQWLHKSKATKKDIQSFVGKLAWAARCVKAIRPCFRSLIDLQKRLKHKSHRTRIPSSIKQDIQYFIKWCVRFNGVVFCDPLQQPQPDTTLFCDASLQAGAAWCDRDFVYSNWEADFPSISQQPIFVKEMCAVLLAVRRWCKRWQFKRVHIYTDNKGVEWALRTGTTRNPFANQLLKDILWLMAWHNVTCHVHYVNTKDNYIADSLSRLDDPAYHHHAVIALKALDIDTVKPNFSFLNHMSLNSYLAVFSRCS